MELTTPLINGFFAMLTAAALAGLIFYCIGLRTGRGAGYELGRETSAKHWRKLLQAKRESNDDLREQLDRRSRELMALRDNFQAEADDHARFSRHLQAQALDMAERLKKAQADTRPHPDSELIDWLYANSSASHDEATCYLAFDFVAEPDCATSLRSILLLAIQQREQADRESIAAADHPKSTWERIDHAQPATAPMCM